MAHHRLRHALPLFNQICKFSPIVGVFGHRQVGKTTFVSTNVEKYLTLDQTALLEASVRNPEQFLRQHASSRTAFDECQHSPALFPALKEWVRTHKKPGQFVLTGSVRFSSRKAIRESLTGRLVSLELYPMVVSELLETDLPETLPQLLKAKKFDENILEWVQKPPYQKQVVFEKYLQSGGLPGLCFTRELKFAREGISALIDLVLDRDLRMVHKTALSLETLRRFLGFIARRAWQPFRYAEARRVVGITESTQKNILYGLESIFLIRRVPFTQTKGETFIFEDQLEELYLSKGELDIAARLTGALFRNLRAQLGYQAGLSYEVESYRTRSGARVPLVFASQGRRIGFIVLDETNSPSLSQRRAVDGFLRHYPEAKVIYACQGQIQPEVLEERLMKASAASLL